MCFRVSKLSRLHSSILPTKPTLPFSLLNSLHVAGKCPLVSFSCVLISPFHQWHLSQTSLANLQLKNKCYIVSNSKLHKTQFISLLNWIMWCFSRLSMVGILLCFTFHTNPLTLEGIFNFQIFLGKKQHPPNFLPHITIHIPHLLHIPLACHSSTLNHHPCWE